MSRISNPRAKRTIGQYQVVAKLGDGAMSSVFKGRDPATGTTVAIKLASAAMTRDPGMVKRFEQEFRSSTAITHPNVVRGLEFGWMAERPYMIMELVDGED